MLTKFEKVTLHLEYLVTLDFIVHSKNQKKKYHCSALVWELWDMKPTLKKMPINNVFSRRITCLWSNTDAKYIEQNSKQSTTETTTFYLPPKSVDIMMLTNFASGISGYSWFHCLRQKSKGEIPLLTCSMSALRYENNLETNANKLPFSKED